MLRLIAATALLMASACPAFACAIAPTYDPNRALQQYAREDLVKIPEVIVEGVVEHASPDPHDGSGLSRMHIDRVWKGAVASDVVVIFTFQGADCSQAPPFGERIRFGARLAKKDPLLVQDAVPMTPERDQLIQAHEDFLLYNAWTAFDLPVHDSELDQLLIAYQAQTEALRQRAESGDHAARLAYAAHLFDNNERHRSLAAYEGILQDDPADLDVLLALAVVRAQVRPDDEPEATLAEVERKAPKTPEWRRKIAHARFVASGRLTDGWKDWSDLAPARTECSK